MAGKSDYLEAKILNLVLKGVAYAAPTVYVALYTAAPSDAGGGTEVTGGSYARVATATTDWTVSGSSPTQGVNANPVTYPAPTADWGTVTHFALMDAATGGNQLYWGALTTARNILNGDPAPSFAAGALLATED